MLRKTLNSILGCALLLYGSTALAFTLIEIQEQLAPSSSITEATTLEAQVQPIASTIRMQMLSQRRGKKSDKVTQAGRLLAANDRADSRTDFNYLAQASGSSGATGGLGGDSSSLWISTTYNSLENEFWRTSFYGTTQNVLAGFDFTRSDRYILGVALGYEASNYVTNFNIGNEKTRGYNLSPYLAILLSDTWSIDLSLGYGQLNTRQSRTLGTGPFTTIAVDSAFDSTRGFASLNLTNVSALGNWKLTTSLGALATRREQDAYTESIGTTVASSKQTVEQWNLLGEAAYGTGASETFFGAMYENTRDPLKVEFATGEQPANDPDSVLLTAGWRHFGKGLTASFLFSSRVAQEQVKEWGVGMTLRVDL
ncbi:MAG: autotransporter outer membrane beta-barrel domain-containing protein [Betaproteobacteria bacterium]|nr:autotransporter outer membrane beta-barrel domain-containing protein [Betaproteobacteria bacterium]MDH5349991.1 autotransporter outer membrane beta-barrel domain-containing protein [Betaproteobacteria bacterium]